MAEERIDIEVTDKVDANVAKKLNQIAESAEKAETYLDRLKSALASVNVSAVDRLAAAMAKADAAQAKLLNAQARLTAAQNAGSLAAQKVALQQQKVATEAARTEAAQQRAAAATTAAESAAMRLAAAQQRSAGASMQAANATQQSAAAAGQAGAAYNGAATGATNFANASNQAAAAATRANAATGTVATGLRGAGGAHDQYARAARQTNAANANIIAQFQDIGVSLAGGQNPLLVLIQQGSQLSYIASTMEGGWTRMIGVVGRLLLKFAPLIAVLGVLYLAMEKIQESAQGSGLDEYIKTLGLTEREVRKLKDTHVTMGDTIKATWQVVTADILSAFGLSTEEIKSFWSDTVDFILYWSKMMVVGVYGLVATLVETMAKKVANIGIMFKNAGIVAKNLFLVSIEFLVNKTIDGINAIGGAINWLSGAAGLGSVVGVLDHIDLGVGNVADGMTALFDVNPVQDYIENVVAADRYLTGLGNRIGQQARENAQDRLRAQANEIIADRTGGGGRGRREPVDRSAERRVDALRQLNLELDNELARMKLLKDERAIQQRMDQIEEQLAQKKITLNDQERESILGKVRAIEMYKYVQSEMDRIHEEAVGPLRTLNATMDAANELYGRGAISLEQYQAALMKANNAFAEATDPLHRFKEELRDAEQLTGKYGVELERATYLQGIEQEYRARGLSIYDASNGKLREEVALLVARNDALRQKQFIDSQLAGVFEPILGQNQEILAQQAVYAELQRLRDADLIREGDYQRAKAALWLKYNEYKLNATSDFFGALAEVTKRGHGVVGAISKAAAVAEATIQGYLAVQKALASAPPPWNYVAAAAVAVKTGAQVAGILSTNVGSYATGGQFMVQGGKSGVDANNINMNVTRGERVTIETPAQQRANDNGTGSPVVDARTKVVNMFDEASFLGALETEEGERIVMNIIRRNPSAPAF